MTLMVKINSLIWICEVFDLLVDYFDLWSTDATFAWSRQDIVVVEFQRSPGTALYEAKSWTSPYIYQNEMLPLSARITFELCELTKASSGNCLRKYHHKALSRSPASCELAQSNMNFSTSGQVILLSVSKWNELKISSKSLYHYKPNSSI